MKRDKTVTVRVVLSLAMVALACALSYVFTSCTQEPPLPYDGGQREYVDFSLKLTLPGAFTPAATRGGMDEANQNAVNSAVVLVFKDNVLIFQQKGTVSEIDGVTKRVEVILNILPSKGDLYDIMVIGNPPADCKFASYLSRTKDELKSDFNVPVVGRWAGSEFIMYGEKLQTPLNPTANNFEIEMLRSLARVDIGVGVYDAVNDTWAGIPGPAGIFRLREVLVVNSRDKYAVIPAAAALNESGKVIAPTIPTGTDVQGTTAAEAIKYSGSLDITDSYTKSAIFLAEAPNDTHRVTLLVGGSYMGNGTSYYRIDMCVPKAGAPGEYDYLNILRNHLYRISITRVESNGFATPEEALLADPINISTELTVTAEEGLGDIVFDDNNYIQTDASSVLIYGAPDGTKTYPIATVKANFVAGVTATVTGPGILPAINLISGVATPITAILAGTTTGSYTIQVGRLTKVIPVNIQPSVDAHFDFLPFKNVSSISIEKPQPWLTLSQKATYVKSEQRSSYVAGNGGKACFHFDENIATTGNPRMARALVQRNDNSGTTGVVFEQSNLNGMVIGYFGGAKDDYGYTKRLAVEAFEEYQRVYDDTSIGTTPSGIQWGFNNIPTNIVDREFGRSGTIKLGKRTDSGIANSNTYAARYCYDKNRDVDGNGDIDEGEEVVWYLPAQNQLMAAWIALSGVPTTAPFSADFYWSATEHVNTNGWALNFGSGYTHGYAKTNNARVRCVREIP